MVSTRSHPQEFPEPELSPGKPATTRRQGQRTHAPPALIVVWLAISLPLVAWDTGYVMLRPHSMPGGWLHWPLWAPYELYGTIDYIYGWKAFNEKNGFTAAQAFLNIIESLMYYYYLYILFAYGKQLKAQGRGAPKVARIGFLGQQRYVDGKMGAVALLVGYSAALMTISKTVLYGMNEYFSGFDNIGHNSFVDVVFLWVIPNGAWIIFPSYMTYVFGAEILQALSGGKNPSNDLSYIKGE